MHCRSRSRVDSRRKYIFLSIAVSIWRAVQIRGVRRRLNYCFAILRA